MCLFLFFERQNIILGGQGSRKDLGGKLDQVILHENILNKNVLKRERMEWCCSCKVGVVGPPLRSVTSLDSGISYGFSTILIPTISQQYGSRNKI